MRHVVAVFILLFSLSSFAAPTPGSLPLKSGWQIQSSCKVAEQGNVISTTKFQPKDWHKAVVPGGVLANLVADKVYPEPYYGMNLRQIPGVNPIGTMFQNQPMPDDSPFKCSWWYRVEFEIPHPSKGGLGGPPAGGAAAARVAG